ncbi:MAG: hypothetical protein ACLQBD_04465 [Syntrophobacteraceae bacterium]
MKAFQTVRFCTCVILGLLLVSAADLFMPTAMMAKPKPKPPTPVTVVNPTTSPVPVAVTEYHFVGSSGSTMASGGGPLAMSGACSSYGTEARMCTVDEFFSSATLTMVGTGSTYLWASPSIHDCVYNSSVGATQCYEQGLNELVTNDPNYISCAGWKLPGPSGVYGVTYGTVVYTDGAALSLAAVAPCSTSLPVACCAP